MYIIHSVRSHKSNTTIDVGRKAKSCPQNILFRTYHGESHHPLTFSGVNAHNLLRTIAVTYGNHDYTTP